MVPILTNIYNDVATWGIMIHPELVNTCDQNWLVSGTDDPWNAFDWQRGATAMLVVCPKDQAVIQLFLVSEHR